MKDASCDLCYPLGALIKIDQFATEKDSLEKVTFDTSYVEEGFRTFLAFEKNFDSLLEIFNKNYEDISIYRDNFKFEVVDGKISTVGKSCYDKEAKPFEVTSLEDKKAVMTFMKDKTIDKTVIALTAVGNDMVSIYGSFYDTLSLDKTKFTKFFPSFLKDGSLELNENDTAAKVICMKPIKDYEASKSAFTVAKTMIKKVPVKDAKSQIKKLILLLETSLVKVENITGFNEMGTVQIQSLHEMAQMLKANSWNIERIMLFKNACHKFLNDINIDQKSNKLVVKEEIFRDFLKGKDLDGSIELSLVGKHEANIVATIKRETVVGDPAEIFMVKPILDTYNGVMIAPGFLTMQGSSMTYSLSKPYKANCRTVEDVNYCKKLSYADASRQDWQGCANEILSGSHIPNVCPKAKSTPDYTALRTNCEGKEIIVSSAKNLALELICNGIKVQDLTLAKGLQYLNSSCQLLHDKKSIIDPIIGKIENKLISYLKASGSPEDNNMSIKDIVFIVVGLSGIIIITSSIIFGILIIRKKKYLPLSQKIEMPELKPKNQEKSAEKPLEKLVIVETKSSQENPNTPQQSKSNSRKSSKSVSRSNSKSKVNDIEKANDSSESD